MAAKAKKASAKKTAKKAVRKAGKTAKKVAGAAKTAAKKAPAKKTAAKKAPAKKTAAKKAPAKKTAVKKAPAKKAPAKKTAAKTAPAKKTTVKKTAAKKAPAKKTATKKKAIATGAMKAEASPPPAAAAPAAAPAPRVMLQEGDTVPDFTLNDQSDTPVTLSALRGRKVVIYFYPRDNTPGCTIEGRDFSTLLEEFAAKNALVYGISTDSTASHRKFQNTCELKVPLLSDPDRTVHEIFGAWGTKNMYGRIIEGTIRSTFVIDEEGRVALVWPKVKVEDHALDVLNAI